MRFTIFFLFIIICCGACQTNQQDSSVTASAFTCLDTLGARTIFYQEQPVFTYQIAKVLPAGLPNHYRRAGFIHPAYSPSGSVVTDDFPVGHAHQHGIFMAWVNTTFKGSSVDFWNQQKGTGDVAQAKFSEPILKDGKFEFNSQLIHLSKEHQAVLREYWDIKIHPRSDVYVWDIFSKQENVTSDTLYIKEHIYGPLGVRGNRAWNRDDSTNFTSDARFLTSEGLERDSANHSRPSWTAMYGELTNGTAGIATIPYPSNFRAPQWVRVHPDMPYFSVTPTVGGDFSIAPGEIYESAFRFVVFDGEPDIAVLNQLQEELD